MALKRVFTLLFVLMALGTTSWAQTLYVGGKKVDLNATTTQTITGSGIEGKVTYSPSSKTLYLEGATIRGSIYGSDLGSSASTRYFIYLKGANNLITSDRGIRFDNSYVVLYGADGSDGASLTINSENSNSGFSCISTEGGHFEVWSVKLNMIGVSKGFYGTPGSATLSFSNSIVQIDCNAGAIYGYKSVSFDDCKVTTRDVKFQSGKGYVDSAGDLVSALNVWPLLCVGGEPVRTASSTKSGTSYPWTWTKSTKTLELTGGFNTKAYPAIANYGIEGLTVKVNDGCAIQSTNTAINIEANTKFEGNGKLTVISTAGNAFVARADVGFNLQALEVYGKLHGFTDVRSGHTLTFYYHFDGYYKFCGEKSGDICSSNLVFSNSNTDISNDNTYWNPSDGYVYFENSIKKATPTIIDTYTTIVSSVKLDYYGIYVGETHIRQNCTDYIMPPGLTSGTIKFNPSSNTLTLTDVTLTNTDGEKGSGIYNTEYDGLNVKFVGNSTITARNSAVYSEKSFNIIGDGSLIGTANNGYGLYMAGNDITCTINGPTIDFTGSYGMRDYRGTATLYVRGSSTRLTLYSKYSYNEAILNLGSLLVGDDIGIVEPAGGYFDSSLKSITTDGNSTYKGKVVFGYATMVRGDVNLDGKVDIADAVSVLNAMAGQEVKGNADVNGDYKIDIADFVSVLNIMAGQ